MKRGARWWTSRPSPPSEPGRSPTWRPPMGEPGSPWVPPPARTPITGWCSPGAARGSSPPPWSPRGRPGPRPSCAGSRPCSARTTWWWSCGTTATLSTRPATTPSWPSPTAAAPRSSPPTTSTTTIPPAVPWPPPWPRCGPGAAWTTSTGGCRRRPRPTCGAGPNRLAASPATPAWWNEPPSWAGTAPSTWPWWRPTCRPGPLPPGTPR